MRKLLIPLLMASVSMPAAASARDGGDLLGALRQHAAESRKERSSEDRTGRAERPARPERTERSEQPVRVERADSVERLDRPQRIERVERTQRIERVEHPRQVEVADQPQRVERVERARRVEDSDRSGGAAEMQQRHVRVAPSGERVRRARRSDDSLVGGFRTIAREQQSDDGALTGMPSNTRRDRTSERRHRWSGDWRRDHRYDWRTYRDRHRVLFRLGRYYDPYGWNYRRFSIGFSLWPSYYGSSFWLNDPWMYRLPPAHGPYRWVRYYDDALLVNIYTGQVVDVLYNFFW